MIASTSGDAPTQRRVNCIRGALRAYLGDIHVGICVHSPSLSAVQAGRAHLYLIVRDPYLTPIMAQAKSDPNYKIIAENRRARFDYFIESDIEVGIVLTGSEVKALRTGQSNIAESYASVENGELWLINGYISAYKQAGVFGHEERRHRKLLVSRKELSRLWQAIGREGMTLVPLVMYFNHRGIVKMKLGVAKGKKNHDKRATEAKRDWGREKQRLLKHG